MFTASETFADLGGWEAVGLMALWLVPLIVLLGLALARPSVAQRVLVVLSAVWVVAALWSIVATDTWRSFESTNGPVRAVACLALMMPVAAVGWHRASSAGVMLLVIGLAAVVAGGSAPLLRVAVAAIVIGALLLAAGLVERDRHRDKVAGPPNHASTRPA